MNTNEHTFGERNLAPRLPHSGKMHWLDWAEVSGDGKRVRAGRRIVAGQLFLVEGVLLASALMELMAQGAAAGAIVRVEKSGRKLRRGVLAAVKEMRVLGKVRLGDEVIVEGVEERSFGGFSVGRLEARVGGVLVAEGVMTFHLEFE